MEIITIEDKDKWNEIVKSFPHWDVYYLNEYAKSFGLHGDGVPYLLYWSDGKNRMAYVVMENDIADFKPFRNHMKTQEHYDWTTPYGYGGPLLEGEISLDWIHNAEQEKETYAKEHNIVSEFFRFHPLLQNQKKLESDIKVLYMKKTVYIDTQSEDVIYANMTPNNRNMVRKAEKNGVQIFFDKGEKIDEFVEIYNETMQNHNADEYYFFEKKYFEFIKTQMKENVLFGYAEYEGKIVSASIFFFNEEYMHYHLSGTLFEYRNLGAANLLLTKAALWASEHQIKEFHLGGGVENEDSLLRFKKHFNRNGLIDFCIGSKVFLPEVFEELVKLRTKVDSTFDLNKPFMIKYRG